ncbi:MAG: proline dehydrogenase family protein [Kyrpidia tusciae]|nr:proline dehydrogenase family protein [Kyrpidia tusciae]MBE3552549.1 proline dehydrogenase family protein [Kyrpidia tusciae]
MEQWMRKGFHRLAASPSANRMARRWGLRFGAARFVAGETLEKALEVVRDLNHRGLEVTLDHLGESVSDAAEAAEAARACLDTLEGIDRAGVRSHLSIKLTQLGLDIDRSLAEKHVEQILERAGQAGTFVRIDMEDSAHLPATLELFREMRRRCDHVGIAIQAYLYRSEQDLRELEDLGANVRLVKGAYREPPSVAFPDKRDVDQNMKKLIDMHLQSGCYTAVASHDPQILRHARERVEEWGIPRDRFEFQMLYGIRPDLQRDLVERGYRVRIYVPYGTDWFAYFMRRLAERPANVWFVLKNVGRHVG